MDSAATPSPVSTPTAAPARKARAKVVLPALIGVALLAGLIFWLVGRGKESTDDAFVEGRVANVSARVGSQVARVLVKDNQVVKAGDVLVELDRTELDARLQAAEADALAAQAQLSTAQAQLALTEQTANANLRQARGGVTQANSGVSGAKASLDQARADVQVAQTKLALAEKENARAESLVEQKVISQAERDARQAAYDTAKAGLLQAQARLQATEASVGGSSGGLELAQGRLTQAQTGPQQVAAAQAAVKAAEAKVKQTEAARQLAQLNVSYALVKAPVNGTVSRRTVEPGQNVSPGTNLMALVPTDDVWVVANFKEDQVGEMQPGQKAKVEVDAFGGREFEAHVDSLAGAAGSRFSLLPPDNASGNFVKVVQRIPVLLRFNDLPKDVQLRPGMSVEATVYTSK
ncbi:HlyD family secretion protein [Aggregicoccus sp. 17bor-14]|uniref:HlyD family secretion protein n=1 Tax=Myxococcaceae TaxID=31 RepID=UPI00129CF969|nr:MULTISPECIES: HlyD family secretion protein [Myxococcaceae]MBF5042221.1 HlyD family secretion protein [Simulacricoccus sp. 17bor-14]MRI87997.1 HlyD family secretion protein [Aggregicoccus sp. 17bor-14]